MPPEHPGPWTPPAPLPGPIETPRLIIRPPTQDDAEQLFDAIESSRDTLLPWLPWAKHENRTLAETHYTIEHFSRAHNSGGDPDYGYLLSIFDKQSGELIGGTGLNRIRPDMLEAETGYWMRADRRGEGLIPEATGHLISNALTPPVDAGWGFRRIVILCAVPNTSSARVPIKLGLKQELHGTRDRWVDGFGWVDTLGWGVDAEGWDFSEHRVSE